ncbi:MAG: hypothetical protein AAF211_16265 [Myxococcota bacterium]
MALESTTFVSGAEVTPESVARDLCTYLEALPPEVARLWWTAERRRFDFGFESGAVPPAIALVVTNGTLARIAALKADVVITIYPVPDDSNDEDRGPAQDAPGRPPRGE